MPSLWIIVLVVWQVGIAGLLSNIRRSLETRSIATSARSLTNKVLSDRQRCFCLGLSDRIKMKRIEQIEPARNVTVEPITPLSSGKISRECESKLSWDDVLELLLQPEVQKEKSEKVKGSTPKPQNSDRETRTDKGKCQVEPLCHQL